MSTEKKTAKIEYEQVSLRIPKAIMDYLRKTEDNPVQALEYDIVDLLRGQVEGMSGKEWADLFHLSSVFYAVLGDERYKPQEQA
jgi:hypothetical protein